MMRQLAEMLGRRPRIMPVPVLSPGLSSYWLGLVTAVPASVARALIGGLKHDLPARDEVLRRLVPQRLLGFREAVQVALQAERDHTVAARWTEGAMMFRNYRQDNAYYAKRAAGSAVGQATPGGTVARGHRHRRRPGLRRPGLAVVVARRHRLAGRRARACRAAGVTRRTCGPGTASTTGPCSRWSPSAG